MGALQGSCVVLRRRLNMTSEDGCLGAMGSCNRLAFLGVWATAWIVSVHTLAPTSALSILPFSKEQDNII